VKTLTCKQLGGACDQQLTADSWKEMVQLMTKHVMENHPDVAKKMEAMYKQDPQQWAKENKPKWDEAHESFSGAPA
jgi:predicted small metal-binding protein